jgi:hypothetical protein
VNSEEGYQNVTRFLFGGLRVDGILDIDDITLPEAGASSTATRRTIPASRAVTQSRARSSVRPA